jgi:serine protease inhibitor
MAQNSMAGPGVAAARAQAVADEAFGVDLYRVLGGGGSNTVFSPASIAAALRMALCGARGKTASEIAEALHLSGDDTLEAAQEGLRLLSEVARDDGKGTDLTLRAPDTMWLQSGYPLLPTFTSALRGAAAVSVRQADFGQAPDGVRAEINRLIADQTAGKITDLLGPGTISADTRLVLANAIYLKAAWATPFPEGATGDAPFYPDAAGGPAGGQAGQEGGQAGGAALTVRMMRLTTELPYVRGDGYQAVLLPYKGDRLAMAVVLPDGPLSAFQPRLSADGLRGLLAAATRRRVALSLPKFQQRASFGLIPALRQLGIESAFGAGADFSGITTAEALVINAVVHQAYIDVDEEGTEAAAATAIGFRPLAARRLPDPVTMTVDRPFLFAILDTDSGLPLFFGQVASPESD